MKVDPDSNQEPKSSGQSWWQTFPGVLTATAGMITALAGLIVALNQAGIFPKTGEPATSDDITANSSDSADRSAPEPSASIGETSGSPTIPFNSTSQPPSFAPSDMEVTVGDSIYKVLEVRLLPFGTENKSLKLKIRCTNTNSRYGVAFYNSSLRLIVDGVPRAPYSNFYEVVDAQSAKEGEFDFEVPASAGEVILKVFDDSTGAMAQIPLDLSAVTP